jgi:hypothetical protein
MNYKLLFIFVLSTLYVFFYQLSFDISVDSTFYSSDNKLWAHRVLNPSDAKNLSKEFNGVEIDVFFNSKLNCFEVKHHGEFSDLTLSEYYSQTKKTNLKYWIDFKNLSNKNANKSIELLNSIFIDENSKNDMIVESKNIIQLSKFKNHGFFISYWVESFHFIKSFYSVFEVKKNIEIFSPDVISMPYNSIDFYRKKFPNYPIHCWTNGMTNTEDIIKIQEICDLYNVKVVLTDFQENFLK